MTFAGMLYRFTRLLVKRVFTKNSSNAVRGCLEHHCDKSLNLLNWPSNSSKFDFFEKRAGVVNLQGCGMHWYFTS